MQIFLRILASIVLLVASSSAQRITFWAQNVAAGGGGATPSSFAYIASSVTGCIMLSTSQTNCAYTFHVNPSTGNLLLLGAAWQDIGTQNLSCSDPNNGTWTAIGTKKAGVNGLVGFSGQMFYVAAAVAGSTKVTCTLSSGSTNILIWEAAVYSYTGTISGFDGTPAYSNATAVAGVATTGTLTTANSSDVVFAACLAIDSACSGIGAGYTSLNDANGCDYNGATCNNTTDNYNANTGGLIGYKVGVTAGSQSTTFSTGTTDANLLGITAF